MDFSALLAVMVTLFLLLVCGYICRKTDIIDGIASKRLSKLILSVGQPMMIIAALSGAEYSKENLTVALIAFVIGFVLHLLMAVMAYLICRKNNRADQSKIFEFSLVFANCGFIGFPILDSILGNGFGSFIGAFYFISFHVFLWSWGIIILARGRNDIAMTPKKALVNFGTIPCLIGVALYLLKPYFVLPAACTTFVTYLGNLCTPISVLISGALLATISLKKMFLCGKLYLHSLIKLILFPVLLCLLAKLCGLGETYLLLIATVSGTPSASTITMLAELHDIDPGYASQTVGISSILSVATLPVVLMFASWLATL